MESKKKGSCVKINVRISPVVLAAMKTYAEVNSISIREFLEHAIMNQISLNEEYDGLRGVIENIDSSVADLYFKFDAFAEFVRLVSIFGFAGLSRINDNSGTVCDLVDNDVLKKAKKIANLLDLNLITNLKNDQSFLSIILSKLTVPDDDEVNSKSVDIVEEV